MTALALIGGLILCRMLFVLFDRFMNGFFVDWFEEQYVNQVWQTLDENDQGYYYRSIRWGRVKSLLLEVLVVVVLLWILSVRVISILYSTWRERKVLHAAGQMIGDYMRHDREAAEVFPPDFAEVSMQMTEIKSGILRQEQLLRAEE